MTVRDNNTSHPNTEATCRYFHFSPNFEIKLAISFIWRFPQNNVISHRFHIQVDNNVFSYFLFLWSIIVFIIYSRRKRIHFVDRSGQMKWDAGGYSTNRSALQSFSSLSSKLPSHSVNLLIELFWNSGKHLNF